MSALRGGLGIVGVAMIGFGLWSVRGFDFAQMSSALTWLVGGVIAHDVVLAPLVVALGVVVARVVPLRARTPLVVAFVLWGSLTLIALPALSGLGVRADNPSLLDRPYVMAWLVGSVVVAASVAGYAWLRGVRG